MPVTSRKRHMLHGSCEEWQFHACGEIRFNRWETPALREEYQRYLNLLERSGINITYEEMRIEPRERYVHMRIILDGTYDILVRSKLESNMENLLIFPPSYALEIIAKTEKPKILLPSAKPLRMP